MSPDALPASRRVGRAARVWRVFASAEAFPLRFRSNDPCSRERTNARQVSTSRRGEGVSKICVSAASLAQGAFGVSCGLRRRFVLRTPGQSQSERRTPNQALQRTGVAVTLAAIPSSNQSRPSVALSHARSLFLRSTPQPSRQPRPSLSLGSLGVSSRPV